MNTQISGSVSGPRNFNGVQTQPQILSPKQVFRIAKYEGNIFKTRPPSFQKTEDIQTIKKKSLLTVRQILGSEYIEMKKRERRIDFLQKQDGL